MVRRFRAENIPVGEPDWDNSDASSDEDDYSEWIPAEDPLQQAEESDKDSDNSHDINNESTSISTSDNATESTRNSLVTSCTDGSLTLPATLTSFNEPVGPAIIMPSTATALDFFNITFGNEIMEMLVEQTNGYICTTKSTEY